MLFRGNVLVGYDFDTEGSDFDEMVKNGTLVFSEERDNRQKTVKVKRACDFIFVRVSLPLPTCRRPRAL